MNTVVVDADLWLLKCKLLELCRELSHILGLEQYEYERLIGEIYSKIEDALEEIELCEANPERN